MCVEYGIRTFNKLSKNFTEPSFRDKKHLPLHNELVKIIFDKILSEQLINFEISLE